MSQNMKKFFLLQFCLLCVGSISSCSNYSTDADYDDFVPMVEEDTITTEITPQANARCGVDDVSCNETALINYTQTEADYRAYGERTKKDHLYTQAGAGNNLTATIRPTIEEDVVTLAPATLTEDENLEDNNNEVGIAHNIPAKTYEVICEEECDDFIDESSPSPEFSEESFDIADYVDDNGDADVEFKDVGKDTTIVADLNVEEIKITDETVLNWEAVEGDTLRDLLTKWCAMAGWKLLWQTNRNYTLSAGVMFKGKFADVSSALIRAFARARPAPIATFYKGNRVIVVETMENENAY